MLNYSGNNSTSGAFFAFVLAIIGIAAILGVLSSL